jgi:hypothetical protein
MFKKLFSFHVLFMQFSKRFIATHYSIKMKLFSFSVVRYLCGYMVTIYYL